MPSVFRGRVHVQQGWPALAWTPYAGCWQPRSAPVIALSVVAVQLSVAYAIAVHMCQYRTVFTSLHETRSNLVGATAGYYRC